MRPNELMTRLKQGETLLGLCNMYADPGILEGMCPGWDFVWIDAQHGQMTRAGVIHSVRAAEVVSVPAIVRVPDAGFGTLGLYADMAPSGIMIPMVDTPQQASAVVHGLRFPPLGKRSFGGLRAIHMDGVNYYRERDLVVIAQIETLEALENAEAIAATDGIDVLFFGGDDIKVQTGRPIETANFDDAAMLDAMDRTARAARAAGAFAGCVAGDEAGVRKARDMGYQLIVGGSDVGFILSSARRQLPKLREIIGPRSSALAAPAKAAATVPPEHDYEEHVDGIDANGDRRPRRVDDGLRSDAAGR